MRTRCHQAMCSGVCCGQSSLILHAVGHRPPTNARVASDRVPGAGMCFMFGLRDGSGYEGKKRVCVPKMGLSFLALYPKFDFYSRKIFPGFGWVDGLAWGGGIARSP